jgi:hypothetical protein
MRICFIRIVAGLITTAVTSAILAGCSNFRPFQPPPLEFEMWRKQGATIESVKRALLECGYPSPFNAGKYSFPTNDYVLSNLCMEKLGFGYHSSMSWRTICRSDERDDLPACAYGATVPEPDASKRLSSPFCRDFPNAEVCHP